MATSNMDKIRDVVPREVYEELRKFDGLGLKCDFSEDGKTYRFSRDDGLCFWYKPTCVVQKEGVKVALETQSPGLYGGAHPRSPQARRRQRINKARRNQGLPALSPSGVPQPRASAAFSLRSQARARNLLRRAVRRRNRRRGLTGAGAPRTLVSTMASPSLPMVLASSSLQSSSNSAAFSLMSNASYISPLFQPKSGVAANTIKYTINSNSLIGLGGIPDYIDLPDGAIRIRYWDILATKLSSTTGFNNITFSVNPGLASTFPWLSKFAQNYAEYEFLGLGVVFSADCGFATGQFQGLGWVVIGADPDGAATAGITQTQVEMLHYAVPTRPCDSMRVPLECENSHKLIRTGTAPSGSVDDYDHSLLQIVTNAMPASSQNCGEVKIVYDVILYSPKLTAPGSTIPGAHYTLVTVTAGTNPFGASQTKLFDNIGVTFTGTTLTIPAGIIGTFLLSYNIIGTAAAIVTPAVSYTNATAASYLLSDATSSIGSPASGVSSANFIYLNTFSVTNSLLSTVVTFGTAGTVPTSPTYSEVILTQLSLTA